MFAASIMPEDWLLWRCIREEWLLWRCRAMLAISLREATSAVPLATRRNTSSRVVTLTP